VKVGPALNVIVDGDSIAATIASPATDGVIAFELGVVLPFEIPLLVTSVTVAVLTPLNSNTYIVAIPKALRVAVTLVTAAA
jgi:hypothetical protein